MNLRFNELKLLSADGRIVSEDRYCVVVVVAVAADVIGVLEVVLEVGVVVVVVVVGVVMGVVVVACELHSAIKKLK